MPPGDMRHVSLQDPISSPKKFPRKGRFRRAVRPGNDDNFLHGKGVTLFASATGLGD
jgi:hypothetical protein